MNGVLYSVGTPIGNLEDITLRAIRVLKEADYIFSEDTRVTGKLLQAHDIDTPLKSYNAHASDAKHEHIIELLRDGKQIALVTDAGTPLVSDPGIQLMQRVRQQLGDSIRVEAIPGASALTAAISVSDISCAHFEFLGFLPHKKGRETLTRHMVHSTITSIFYESPHRILKTLDALIAHGAGARRLFVGRELTKMHETHYIGTVEEVRQQFDEHPGTVRGEFVCILAGRTKDDGDIAKT
jgi:16S rRNA (cytidine1402-2'-O)-methyltransferase